jgi:hypothetical protein
MSKSLLSLICAALVLFVMSGSAYANPGAALTRLAEVATVVDATVGVGSALGGDGGAASETSITNGNIEQEIDLGRATVGTGYLDLNRVSVENSKGESFDVEQEVRAGSIDLDWAGASINTLTISDTDFGSMKVDQRADFDTLDASRGAYVNFNSVSFQ